MTTTRRDFIHASALAAAALAATGSVTNRARASALLARLNSAAPMHILILGGTGFLGPICTESALARGHKVTQFNSGRTEERRHANGRPSVVPAGVDTLIGNRDPNKTADDRRLAGVPDDQKKPDPNSPKGLSEIEKALASGAKFDAVIDTSGYFPRMVKASADLLAPTVKQYVFISSISVYKNNDTPDKDESDTLATLSDPNTEDFGQGFANYGGGKAACEQAAEAAMPGRSTAIRAGFIVGKGDTSGRFIYWPVRASKGGEMIVPGKPEDPIQIIDVRDLADFIVTCIETKATGPFNVTGPAKPYPMKTFIEGCIKGVGASTKPTWVDPAFLSANGIDDEHMQGQFPLWLPPEGESAGFHKRDVSKAVKAGLKFRTVDDTAKYTLDWYKTLPEDIQKKIVPAMLDAKEQEILDAWHKKQGG